MKIQWRLYDIGILMSSLTKIELKVLKEIFREYLDRGAHPFFLLQIARFRGLTLRPKEEKEVVQGLAQAGRRVTKDYHEVPGIWATGLEAPISRLYEKGWKPAEILDEGIMHGVLVETVVMIYKDFFTRSLTMQNLKLHANSLFKKFLQHPQASMGLADNLFHQMLAALEWVESMGAKKGEDLGIHSLAEEFLTKRAKNKGMEQVAGELLEIWSDDGAYRFWWLLRALIEQPMGRSAWSKSDLVAAPLLRKIHEAKNSGKGLPRYAATQIFSSYPLTMGNRVDPIDAIMVKRTSALLVERLKSELPNPKAYHALVRWFQEASFETRGHLVFDMAFVVSFNDAEQEFFGVDPRAEVLVEELLGPETWSAVCAFQDSRFWRTEFEIMPRFKYRGGIKKSTPEYQTFERALKNLNLANHDSNLAESLDVAMSLVDSESLSQAKEVSEQAVNLLAGDMLLTVTHLRTEWMKVPRRKDEYLQELFPEVEVARHPVLGENGAACIFRTKLSEGLTVAGELDAEGEMRLERILTVTAPARKALQAVALQTLSAVLIPRFLDSFPPKGQAGMRVALAGEVFASRPVIHKFGELSQEQDEAQGISGGTKIHPVIAQRLFLWLLDEDLEYAFRLHRLTEEKVDGRTERYFSTWREAKDELLAKRVSLADVYLRTVRAYTRPVAVYMNDEGNVIVQKVSNRARRNYERFRADIGRNLDFSSVTKTYIMPDTTRLVLPVPKTFNQGTFSSLEDVWEMVLDRQLRDRARKAFVFENR